MTQRPVKQRRADAREIPFVHFFQASVIEQRQLCPGTCTCVRVHGFLPPLLEVVVVVRRIHVIVCLKTATLARRGRARAPRRHWRHCAPSSRESFLLEKL